MLYIALGAYRKENCQYPYLSHAYDSVELQPTLQGGGEFFLVEKKGETNDMCPIVALACQGKEEGKYLSHGSRKVSLQDGYQGEGEEWILHYYGNRYDKDNKYNYGDAYVGLECKGKETGLYLSHASDQVALQIGFQGEEEVWCQKNLINTLTDTQFAHQTATWQQLEGKSSDQFDFFYSPKLLPGARLHSFAVELLLSRTSVTTLKVRIGVDDYEKAPKLQLILFGTDDFGEVLTPYYVAEPQLCLPALPIKPPKSGNVPIVLFNAWHNYWQEREKEPSSFDPKLFMTHYGFLKGYNYSMKEIYSLLSESATKGVPSIIIRFVLHRFNPIREDEMINKGYTFGLIFQSDYKNVHNASPTDSQALNEEEDDGTAYFDLSTPCPRTC